MKTREILFLAIVPLTVTLLSFAGIIAGSVFLIPHVWSLMEQYPTGFTVSCDSFTAISLFVTWIQIRRGRSRAAQPGPAGDGFAR